VIVAILLVGAQVVRNAAVAALAPTHPAAAAKFWTDHPSVEISAGLLAIGQASSKHRHIDHRTFAMIDEAATKAPLAPEPFLVGGVEASTAGDEVTARLAFAAAQRRDPRSLPAAYFLANYYLQLGKAVEGLNQTALLARLTPQGAEALAPFIAAYARNPANWRTIRAMLRTQERLEDAVLTALAPDPIGAEAILAIAGADHRRPTSPWLRPLLESLVARGEYARARAIWSLVTGAGRSGQLLYDPGFRDRQSPPPFNWQLTTSPVGLAERQAGNRLHLIFYGNEDGALASQLLLLPPGHYRLQMQLAGSASQPETLRWSIRCDKSSGPLATMRLDQAAARGFAFDIPTGCAAQWLELSGRSSDFAEQAEATIGQLALTREGSNE
jgi:hypothetical protein